MSTCTICLKDFDFEKTVSALGHDSCVAVNTLEELSLNMKAIDMRIEEAEEIKTDALDRLTEVERREQEEEEREEGGVVRVVERVESTLHPSESATLRHAL